jgi:hypothetical protein
MQAIRLEKTVEVDGQINLTGLPYQKGDRVELILLSAPPVDDGPPRLTARGLLESKLVGLWSDRDDLTDSPEFARQLREQAQRRDLP